MKARILYSLLTLLIIHTSIAKDIIKLNFENGLSNNNVVSIAQDKDGFLWFSTKDGLNRFDGNKFKIFKHNPNDNNSINNNILNCVYAEKEEPIIWIGSEKHGLNSYNYKTDQFTSYRPDTNNEFALSADGITHITADEKGGIWIATYMGGIEYFDKSTGKFTHYNTKNVKGLVSDYNWYVYPDEKDRIIVGHVFDGFSVIDLPTRKAINYRAIDSNPNSLPDNTVTCILRDSYKNLWIGTRNGLALYNLEQNRSKNFFNSPHNFQAQSTGFIKSLAETSDHRLLIGTEGDGLKILDLTSFSGFSPPNELKVEHIKESLTPEGLSTSSVQSICIDRYENLWLAGYTSGINFISAKDNYFNTLTHFPIAGNANSLSGPAVVAICHDDQNNTWMSTVKGGVDLYKNGVKTRNINRIPGIANPLYSSTIAKGTNNSIWIGTTTGKVIQHIPLSNKFTEMKTIHQIWNTPIYSLFESSDGSLWISSDVGIYKYNSSKKDYTVYTTKNIELHDDNIRQIAEDAEGNIWVGTLGGGLNVYNKKMELIADFSWDFPFFAINHIYKDSKNRMWVGAQNNLYLFLNLNKENVKVFGLKEGLLDNNIKAIVEGKSSDEFWASSTSNLSSINLTTGIIRNFDISNKIVGGDYLPSVGAKSSNGTIYFGSQKGISYFNSLSSLPEYEEPSSSITGFHIIDFQNGNLNKFREKTFSEKLNLKHNQNTFQIDFNTMDFSLSDNVEFMYQMEGLDNEWYYIGNEKQVVFRNLKPGKYVFHLKIRTHNREWTNQDNAMTIRISPPFWFAWYSKLFYLILALFITYRLIKFYKEKIDIENRLLYEKKNREQEHELNEEKIRFYTNITHELRTPMTLIIGPLEELIQDRNLPDKIAGKIKSINRVANRLLRLVNQILEFRNSETSIRQLFIKQDDLSNHVYEIGLKYKELNRNDKINLILSVPDQPVIVNFDPEVITIIVDNLLSNALKYTEQGTVELKLQQTIDGEFSYTDIVVSDTGYGISEKDLPLIFNRYYQAKNTNYTVSGTGIGLALLKNMAELHQAEVIVDSKEKEGTKFMIRLLTENQYPDAHHYEPEFTFEPELEVGDDSRPHILVIDDNKEIVDYIRECLADSYEVVVGNNGEEGFELACEKIPDLVVSDIMMPVMDGIEFCRKMKAEVKTCHIPIVLLTAKGSMQDKTEGYEAGADSYLTKPFSATLLRSRIKNIIDNRKKLVQSSTSFEKYKLVYNESASQLDKDFLKNLTLLIEENIEDEELNISKIASQLNMSHSTLYRKIKGITGMSANEFIRKIKMRVAEQLLLSGKFNINEVMYKIGINSIGYFRQCFRDEFGMNPSDYLQKLKEEI